MSGVWVVVVAVVVVVVVILMSVSTSSGVDVGFGSDRCCRAVVLYQHRGASCSLEASFVSFCFVVFGYLSTVSASFRDVMSIIHVHLARFATITGDHS